MDEQNRDHIRYIRHELRPTVTLSSTGESDYVEILHLNWSKGGNVIFAIPMGKEAIRAEQEPSPHVRPSQVPRLFHYRHSAASVDLIAPDGRRIAVVELTEVDKQIELLKGMPSSIEVGTLTVRVDTANLTSGSKFVAAPRRLACVPSIEGVSPREWAFTIHARFDGSCLSIEIPQMSTAIQNKNLVIPASQLEIREEIAMTIPAEALKLSSTLDIPYATAPLFGKFNLRDRR